MHSVVNLMTFQTFFIWQKPNKWTWLILSSLGRKANSSHTFRQHHASAGNESHWLVWATESRRWTAAAHTHKYSVCVCVCVCVCVPQHAHTQHRVPTLSWRPDSRTFKDFFKHHLFYIKHLSNSHASICSVMKDLTVLNISLTLNIYIKNFRVIMFWMCRFHKFRPFWAVVFKGL